MLVSGTATAATLGGSVENVADVFFNELSKRELGRQKCLENLCSHFVTMDADEYYLKDELKWAKNFVEEGGFDGTACRMRTFFKEPTCELLPPDDLNAVPFIYKLNAKLPFRLVADSLPVMLDPTRGLDSLQTFHMFDRSEIQMYHMSFVRKDMRMKMTNVSNKGNYGAVENFLKEFDTWTPAKGVIHPHPHIHLQPILRRVFNEIFLPLIFQ